jgi:hypothetical protein
MWLSGDSRDRWASTHRLPPHCLIDFGWLRQQECYPGGRSVGLVDGGAIEGAIAGLQRAP